MNIAIISTNSVYKELFHKNEEIKTVLFWDSVKKATIEVDALFLDGSTFRVDDLSALRELYPDTPAYYKPVSIHSDLITRNIRRLCAAHKVHMINEYTTEVQTIEYIINELTGKEDYLSKRIISFFGTHSGAGVTTTVLNLARSLSKRVEDKVLVLSLNSWDPADYFYSYQGQYLNDLKVDLNTKNLTPDRLTEALAHFNGFYHLAGNRDIKMQRFYQPYEIEHLLSVAKEIFDVILIDAGTHFDTAPTIQSYLSSNLRFLLTNQEEKGYRGYFPYVFHQLIEPSGGRFQDFMLIINKFQPGNMLISEKMLEEELQMTRVATLPDMGELGVIAAFQKKLLYDLSDSIYTKNIDLLSNLIISECRLTEKELPKGETKEKKRLFSLF